MSELEKETALLNRLTEKFSAIDAEKATMTHHRLYVPVPGELFMDVLKFAAGDLKCTHLSTITGLDAGDGLEFAYHISNEEGIVLTLKLKVSADDPVIQSVLPIYNGATFYERELQDILGVKVEGLPEGRRYPLPDSWPEGQYPLRKSWTLDMLKAKSEEG